MIDPSGMISPSYSDWSLEFWLIRDRDFIRLDNNAKNPVFRRDPQTASLQMDWKDSFGSLSVIFAGARSSHNEAIIEVTANIRDMGKGTSLVIAIRPYSSYMLGGISKISYDRASGCVTVNKHQSVCMLRKPDSLLTGSGESAMDLFPGRAEGHSVSCKYGLASMGFSYDLKKGATSIDIRVSLEKDANLAQAKINFSQVRDEFYSYARTKLQRGITLVHPDNKFQSWLCGSKMTLLGSGLKEYRDDVYCPGKTAYLILRGINRAGYSDEAAAIIDLQIRQVSHAVKELNDEAAMGISYMLISVADTFLHNRDLNFLQAKYAALKPAAKKLLNYADGLKNFPYRKSNLTALYLLNEGLAVDFLIIVYALEQYSYLARCLGIFGEEKMLISCVDRLAPICLKALLDPAIYEFGNEFILTNLMAGYPYRLNSFSNDLLKALIAMAQRHFKMPPVIPCAGQDVVGSLSYINCLLYLNDKRALDCLDDLLPIDNHRYQLPEHKSTTNDSATWGRGVSAVSSSFCLSAIRNSIFIDHAERFEICPVCREEWFKTGSEMILTGAPSRFGNINLRMAVTEHEIQFFFEGLPKFIPPDILIHLPFKAVIKPGDDFVIKKDFEDSFVINGWPAYAGFIRK